MQASASNVGFTEVVTFCDDFLSLLSVAVASLLHKKPIQHFYELMDTSVSKTDLVRPAKFLTQKLCHVSPVLCLIIQLTKYGM